MKVQIDVLNSPLGYSLRTCLMPAQACHEWKANSSVCPSTRYHPSQVKHPSKRGSLPSLCYCVIHPHQKRPLAGGSRRETSPRVPPVPIKEAHPVRRMTAGLRRHSSMVHVAMSRLPSFYFLRRRRRRRLRMVSRGHSSSQVSSTPRKFHLVQWKRVVIVIHPLILSHNRSLIQVERTSNH